MPQLKDELEQVYVHEINCIGASNGELYLSHEGGTVVFNVSTLFSDLPTIVRLATNEQIKENNRIIHAIQNTNKKED